MIQLLKCLVSPSNLKIEDLLPKERTADRSPDSNLAGAFSTVPGHPGYVCEKQLGHYKIADLRFDYRLRVFLLEINHLLESLFEMIF